MKQFDKWWMPDHEEHLPQWMSNVNLMVDGRLTYQYSKYETAMAYVKNRGRAVDVGAHIGLWSYWMARDFNEVEAFEPVPEHYECWEKNLAGASARCYTVALGNQTAQVCLKTRTRGSSGDTGIDTTGQIYAEMVMLDSLGFTDVGFLKIDTEGYELNVLQGAEKTLLASKPCVVVEQKGDMSQKYGIGPLAAVEYLQSLGASVRATISGDYVLAWD